MKSAHNIDLPKAPRRRPKKPGSGTTSGKSRSGTGKVKRQRKKRKPNGNGSAQPVEDVQHQNSRSDSIGGGNSGALNLSSTSGNQLDQWVPQSFQNQQSSTGKI